MNTWCAGEGGAAINCSWPVHSWHQVLGHALSVSLRGNFMLTTGCYLA